MVETSEERWTDHVVPDLRQCKRRALKLSEDEESGKEFDFGVVDQMESSEDEDGLAHQQPKAGPSKPPNPTTGNSMSRGVPYNKAPIGPNTMAPWSKQRNMGLDTGMMGATGTDADKGKIQDQVKKAKFTMDIPANSRATGKPCLFYFQVGE